MKLIFIFKLVNLINGKSIGIDFFYFEMKIKCNIKLNRDIFDFFEIRFWVCKWMVVMFVFLITG